VKQITLKYPLTPAHERLRVARGRDTVQINFTRSDHPIHVNQAFVRAPRRKLFLAELIAAFQTRAVGLPQRNVAGGVLIEQRIQKLQSAGSDG
jgi:hypothetical protein